MRQAGLFGIRGGITPLKGLLLVFSVMLSLVCIGYAQPVSVNEGDENPTDDVTYLTQYGTWIDVQPFGSVWQPSVSPDWRPFVYGHWVWTDAGWAWVSYEPYGWLVFHYGNWDFQPDIGWFWIEGTEWSPAWVEWLNYDGYCSWAPLPPVGVKWQEPWHEGGFHCWVVVRDQDLDFDNIGHYRIDRPPLPRDADRRDVIHEPLGVHDFEKITGRNVTPEPLRHGPGPVYMNPRHAAEHLETPPGEVQHEQKPPEHATPPAVVPSAENRPMERQSVQLHRMILPESELARVRRYSPQVEQEVLVPRSGHGNAPKRSNKK